jgi:hypothetical protein
MSKVIEAEIIEEVVKAPVLKDIKYPVKTVDLDKLLEQYKEIPNIDPESDEAGEQYQYVRKGHLAFVSARTSIEKVRKELKAPAFEYGKKVDNIAKEFQSKIAAHEQKLFAARKAVEDYEQLKQEEAERAEAERQSKIKSMIEQIKNLPLAHYNANSEKIKDVLSDLSVPDASVFEEFEDEAVAVYQTTVSQLQNAYETKVKAEQADRIEAERKAQAEKEEAERQAALKAERDAFEAQQAAFRKQQEEADRLMREQQEEINRQRAEMEAEKLMAKQAEERAEREKREAIEKAEQEAAEKKAKAEKEKADKDLYEQRYNAAYDAIDGMDKTSDILQAIISGDIPNVKWSPDEN